MKTHRFRAAARGIALAFAVTAGLNAVAQDSGSSRELARALEVYNAANYDKAIEMLTGLSADRSLSKLEQRQVWLVLGRSYIAKSLNQKAADAIQRLVELEPPIVELDPDDECPPLMKIYYQVRKARTGGTTVERSDPGMKTIAVLDFMNRSIDDKEKYDPMQKGFADLVINSLQGAVNLKVVERERIGWLMEEIGMQNDPQRFNQETAVRMGKLLGAHSVLLGNFIKAKADLTLGARLVKVETGEILMGDVVKGEADSFFELAEKLSGSIATKINAKFAEPRAEAAADGETKSLEAMMAYSEGLVFLEKGEYKMAYDKFMEALERDPSYERARQKADSLKPVLG